VEPPNPMSRKDWGHYTQNLCVSRGKIAGYGTLKSPYVITFSVLSGFNPQPLPTSQRVNVADKAARFGWRDDVQGLPLSELL